MKNFILWIRKTYYPYALVAPAFIILFLILIYPLGYSLKISFQDWSFNTYGSGKVPFIGVGNFIKLLQDSYFWLSLKNTCIFSFSSLSIEFFLGLGIALLLNRKLIGGGIIKALIILPFVLSNAVIGLDWRLMYNYDYGIINYFLSILRVSPVLWLSDPSKAMMAIIIVDVWNCTSFVVLLLLSGLQAIPRTPYEAAKIDGASRWQLFKFITLPLLKPVMLIILIWRTIDLFRMFDMVYILTGGGPSHATEVTSIYAFYNGFRYFQQGYAAAVSWVLVIIMIAISFAYIKLMRTSLTH